MTSPYPPSKLQPPCRPHSSTNLLSPLHYRARPHHQPIMDNLSNIFRLANLGIAVLMVLGGISQFFPISLQSVVIGCYVILFGLGTALLEFQIPPQLQRYASFMFSFLGRGVCKSPHLQPSPPPLHS